MKTVTSESVEFEGKTVERALEAARRHFGLSDDQMEIEILTKGSTGIFGLGGRKARIKVVPKAAPQTESKVSAPAPDKSPPEKKLQDTDRASASLEGKTPEISPSEVTATEAPKHAVVSEKFANETPDREKVLQKAMEVAKNLFEKTGLDCRTEIKTGPEGPFLDINGPDISIVIGREGQTLSAFEYIINRITAREIEGSRGITVDAQGYREKRNQSLASLAQRMAIKAKKTGKSVALSPMGARERRIIHISLRNFSGVKTRSVGDGRERKVIITPLNRRYRNRKRTPGRKQGA